MIEFFWVERSTLIHIGQGSVLSRIRRNLDLTSDQRQNSCPARENFFSSCSGSSLIVQSPFLLPSNCKNILSQMWKLFSLCNISNVTNQYELPCTLNCLNFQHKQCRSMGKYKTSATFVIISTIIGHILVGHKTYVHGNQ